MQNDQGIYTRAASELPLQQDVRNAVSTLRVRDGDVLLEHALLYVQTLQKA